MSERAITERERAAFLDGVLYGTEQTIAAHDALLELVTRLGGLLVAIARHYDDDEIDELAATAEVQALDAFAQVRAQRGEAAQRSALAMWEAERALLG